MKYFIREVEPHVPDAWMDRSKDKVGYEINFNRHFYRVHSPTVSGGNRRATEGGRSRDGAAACGR